MERLVVCLITAAHGDFTLGCQGKYWLVLIRGGATIENQLGMDQLVALDQERILKAKTIVKHYV